MKMDWQDTTTYSQGDEERIPSIWYCYPKNKYGRYLAICVHRHIDYPKDIWLLSCHPFFIKHQLKNKNINKAKREAIRKVKKELKLTLDAFKNKKYILICDNCKMRETEPYSAGDKCICGGIFKERKL